MKFERYDIDQKSCKLKDSKVPKPVARVLLSLVQSSEDIVSVDRGKLHFLLGSKTNVEYVRISLLWLLQTLNLFL